MFKPINDGPEMSAGRNVQRAVAEDVLGTKRGGRVRRYRWPGDPEPQQGVGPFNRVPAGYKPRSRRSPWMDGR